MRDDSMDIPKKTHINTGPATHPSHAKVFGKARILAPTIAQNTCRLVDITVPVLEFGKPIESFRATNFFTWVSVPDDVVLSHVADPFESIVRRQRPASEYSVATKETNQAFT